MTGNPIRFDEFLAGEIKKYKGVCVPVKAAFLTRVFVKKAALSELHPNPGDEFSMPEIGPSYTIIADYESRYRKLQKGSFMQVYLDDIEPLIVEKMRPDGYMILNGHHRWAGAMRAGLKDIPIRIVNLTQEVDIRKMLQASRHNKRVTLDLDEVVFRAGNDALTEKALPFPLNRIYKERVRLGIPALFHYLTKNGYDIWVYTAQYYSVEYIQHFFRKYLVHVNGIVTGTARKTQTGSDTRKKIEKLIADKYQYTIHIDNGTVLRTFSNRKDFEESAVDGSSAEWSQQIMDIIREMEKHA